MTDRHEDVLMDCPNEHCDQVIQISKNWTAGGMNDHGGFVLRCEKCNTVFHYRLGRDVNDLAVISGAKLLDRYDDDLNDKTEILKKHGITEEVSGGDSVNISI